MRNKSFNQDEILAAIEKEVSHEPECELFLDTGILITALIVVDMPYDKVY